MLWMLLGIVIVLLACVLVWRSARLKPAAGASPSTYQPSADLVGARKLAEAIRIPTLSNAEPEKRDGNTFLRFQALLERQFPKVHQACEKTVVNGLSLVYHYSAPACPQSWKPVLITAHMDVVPVEPGTEAAWNYPPFGGDIAEGVVWGRGALDTKVHLIGAMEALERMLAEGKGPARDLYFAFGHDEEINGEEGAVHLARYFSEQGLTFDFVLDEGGCVVQGALDGIERPLAMVGIGEKGFANIQLSVHSDGGHASMPAAHTSLGLLAQAICRLEAHPLKPRLTDATRAFLLRVAPYMRFSYRLILANLWLFEPLFVRLFAKGRTGGALLRTTVAVTMAQGAPAPNVVPQTATACINCRILPGETGETLLAHLRRQLRGLPVTLTPLALDDPSALSPTKCDAYRLLERLIPEYCGDGIVVPYLVMAGTDARKYEPVCEHIYRFTPYVIDNTELEKIHGTDENITVENVNRCIDFFHALFSRV